MRVLSHQAFQQHLPILAGGGKAVAPDQQAEIGTSTFDRLQPGITTPKQDDLDMLRQFPLLARRQAKVALQPDQILATFRRCPHLPAYVVFPTGEEKRFRLDLLHAVDLQV